MANQFNFFFNLLKPANVRKVDCLAELGEMYAELFLVNIITKIG